MAVEGDFFDAGQPIVNPLVKSGPEDPFGRDDVDGCQVRQPREQIEISDAQSTGFGNPIGDRDDQVADGRRCRRRDQSFSQRVLVAGIRVGHATLVGSKRVRQHPRLPQHALGAAIELGIVLERLFEKLLETRHLLTLTSKLVVEAEHLGHEAWTQLARLPDGARVAMPTDVEARLPGGGTNQRLAVVGGQPARRIDQAGVQAVVKPFAGDGTRPPEAGPSRGIFVPPREQPAELSRRAGIGNDHES